MNKHYCISYEPKHCANLEEVLQSLCYSIACSQCPFYKKEYMPKDGCLHDILKNLRTEEIERALIGCSYIKLDIIEEDKE